MINLIMTALKINWKKNQYNATLAITGVVWGTLRDKIYKMLGLESIQSRRSFN